MKSKAFTLIELLIVVAIIAILAAIAVPNFLEAQTRAKVSRLKADMRTGDVGEKAYYVDNNRYTWDRRHDALPGGPAKVQTWFFDAQYKLTTPVAYLSSVKFPDPFYVADSVVETGQIVTSWKYFNLGYGNSGNNWGDGIAGDTSLSAILRAPLPTAGYVFNSYGPDRVYNAGEWTFAGLSAIAFSVVSADRLYDPTNGTNSGGDIVRLERPGLDIK